MKFDTKVACVVGSRAITDKDKDRIERVGYYLSALGFTGRSGNAEGTDQEWDKYIFVQHILPWNGYNGAYHMDADGQYLALEYAPEHLKHKAKALVYDVHPTPDFLRDGAMKMHMRNMFQPLGLQLAPATYADITIYCAPESLAGVVKGGTASAVNLSRMVGIPTFNLRRKHEFENLMVILEKEADRLGIQLD